MIVVKKEDLEKKWESTSHDESDNVQRSNVFYWPDLLFKDEVRVKLAFMHLARLKPYPNGWFSKHHRGEQSDPTESNPQIGMLEVFIHKSGEAAMYIGEDKEIIINEETPVVVVMPGEIHSMQNIREFPFDYWVFGFSTGGGTWVVE